MCGRFAFQLPAERIAQLFRTSNPLPNLEPNWNVAPTHAAMVIRRNPESGERHLDLLRWGLVPHFTKDLKTCKPPINARSETIATSGIFRGALKARAFSDLFASKNAVRKCSSLCFDENLYPVGDPFDRMMLQAMLGAGGRLLRVEGVARRQAAFRDREGQWSGPRPDVLPNAA